MIAQDSLKQALSILNSCKDKNQQIKKEIEIKRIISLHGERFLNFFNFEYDKNKDLFIYFLKSQEVKKC